jgi:hypothetical protein
MPQNVRGHVGMAIAHLSPGQLTITIPIDAQQ